MRNDKKKQGFGPATLLNDSILFTRTLEDWNDFHL